MVAVTDLSFVSRPSRVAGAEEGISFEELGLAARNHAMPAEALRYDVTPAGVAFFSAARTWSMCTDELKFGFFGG